MYIIARSEDKYTEKKILKAGADAIISPYDSAGRQIADNLLAATGGSGKLSTENPDKLKPEWIIVHEGSGMINESIGDIARSMHHDVIGLRRGCVDMLQPDSCTVVLPGDRLLVISEQSEIALSEELQSLPRKIVIVDDNPVIVRLYARLFQKAGFHPLTADNGDTGLALIAGELPAAAVIDFMLPGLSGLEICRRVRQEHWGETIKLIVFTADDDQHLRTRCLEAGADDVYCQECQCC